MENQLCFFINKEAYAGSRIDLVLAEKFSDFSRSYLQKLILDGQVTVNGRPARKQDKVKMGDRILLLIPPPVSLEAKPENIPLEILYEDFHLLVVNKPKGMVVHPAPGNIDKTLVNALLFHCKGELSGINGVIRPGIVHRIDKDTSGLLVVAKDDETHRGLAEQIKAHTFTREYHAVVYGTLKQTKGKINAPIGRDTKNRKKMTVFAKNAKPAITEYETLDVFDKFTYLCLRLQTGRTHQIRVHMSYIGHPVAGDPVYGPKKIISRLQGQCLHAKKIGFIHPKTKKYLEFDSKLPEVFQKFLDQLKKGVIM